MIAELLGRNIASKCRYLSRIHYSMTLFQFAHLISLYIKDIYFIYRQFTRTDLEFRYLTKTDLTK